MHVKAAEYSYFYLGDMEKMVGIWERFLGWNVAVAAICLLNIPFMRPENGDRVMQENKNMKHQEISLSQV